MITTVTLNASIDKAYQMKTPLRNGSVMRVASCHNTAGGKGLNVARIIRRCGEQVMTTGLVGGFNGQYLESLLDRDGLAHEFQHISGETRSCINILDEEYGSTEYLEPGCTITDYEEQQFMQLFATVAHESSIITISGSIPQGLDTGIYERMVSSVRALNKPVILDTSGEALKKGLQARPTMVKPNQDELEALLGKPITGIAEVIASAKEIHAMGIPYVVVSLGGDGALMVCKDGVFHGKPPKVEVVNTVGCGDSMVGAFAVALKREYTAPQALQYAVAVATANALSPHTGDFDPAVFDKIYDKINIETL